MNHRVQRSTVPRHIKPTYESLLPGSSVLDIGCFGFKPVEICGALQLREVAHAGVDYCEPADLPPGYTFRKADLNRDPLPFADDGFDLVVVSHVIEHVLDPINLVRECIRVCKPGGRIYVEAPSERSLFLPGMPFEHEKFFSLSYYDDPTHLSRPWTPQALVRLARYFSCTPERADYIYSWKYRILFPVLIIYALVTRSARRLEHYCWQSIGWASFAIVRKPESMRGVPEFIYYLPKTR